VSSTRDERAAEIERRKSEHLSIATAEGVETPRSAGWDDVHLVHDALPRVDAANVDLSVELLGHELRLPLAITGMTGGHQAALEVNRVLASAAERHGLAFGVGSQRAALRDPSLVPTYAVAREAAPTAFVIGNIGISQLLGQPGEPALQPDEISRVVDMVRADALAVHLNYLEEIVQPEGQTRAHGADDALARLAQASPVPIIAKETGAGIGRATALRLADLGVRAIDVGGVGGTSFAAIEARRARDRDDHRRALLGERFVDWGLTTAVAVVAATATGLPIIATGGVRSGHDAAKALALGATLVGVGRPLLQAALRGEAAVDEWIGQFALELRTASFLTGVDKVRDLRSVPRVILGATREWISQLGY
jgi:isopentenyl-diphosphate Delta-isomerase